MKTKTIDLYEFDELPSNVKAKVLDNNRYINVDDEYWYDYDGKTGFSAAEIKKYRLDLEQSDELITYKKLYFDIDRAWYIQFIDAEFKHDETARKFLGVPKSVWDKTHWTFLNRDYGGNSHGTTKLEWEYDGKLTDRIFEIMLHAANQFESKMEEALKGLQSSYEYSISDEAVIDTIKANEYTFRSNGKMENA